MSRVKYAAIAAATLCLALVPLARSQQGRGSRNGQPGKPDRLIEQNANAMLEEGRRVFRFETFSDQAFWSDSLKLHQAIEGSKLGGGGAGVSPATALSVGLKVDVDALPGSLQSDIAAGKVHLDDPAVTLALLQLNAVVGVTGFSNSSGGLQSVGIQCALCHSTVDDSFAPGIGHRLDGWANRDLNVGAVQKSVLELATKLKLVSEENATSQALKKNAQEITAKLNAPSGKAFDKFYIDNEVAYHTQVTEAVETVLIPNAKNAELKSALTGAQALFLKHLEHARMIQARLGGASGTH